MVTVPHSNGLQKHHFQFQNLVHDSIDDSDVPFKVKKKKKEPRLQQNFKCEICDKEFPRKAFLQRHIDGVHTLKKDHTCDICGQTFPFKSYLEKHYGNCQKKANVLKNLKF